MDPDWVRRVELRLITLEKRSAVDEVHLKNITLRLSAIEEALKWVVRLILGGFVMAVLAYVIQGGLVRPM